MPQQTLWDEAKHPRDASGEFTSGPARPAEPEGGATWQKSLFQKSAQTQLFEEAFAARPKKKAKDVPSPGPSLLEQLEDALRKQSQAAAPKPGQREMFRRNGQVQQYRQEADDGKSGQWVTIGGHAADGKRHAGGTPVKVSRDGTILAGPDSLEGQDLDELGSDRKPKTPRGDRFDVDDLRDVTDSASFRQWASDYGVPNLMARGYGKLDAQMIVGKQEIAIRRREKNKPIDGSLRDAVGEMNRYLEMRPTPEPDKHDAAPPSAAVASPAPAAQAQEPATPEVPEAPEWVRSLKSRLEASLSTPKSDEITAENPAAGASATDGGADDGEVWFKEWNPAEDDPASAPPPAVPKLPGAVDPLTRLHRNESGRLVGATQLHVDQLKADPSRFQYKFVGVGEGGVTKELKDAKRFNPMLGGQLLVWQDPADGQTYVVNGHHRFDLARRSMEAGGTPDWQGELSVYFINAADASEARALGAVTNIAEGRGTVIDAAKFLRDSGAGLDELEQHGVSVRGAMARDAIPLSQLSPRIWQKVAQEMVTPARGLAIAKHLGDSHDLQDQLFGMIEQREAKAGKPIPESHVEEMAREMAMTPKHQESGGLFGDFFERSLLPERAQLKAAVRHAITADLNAFKAVSSTRRSSTLQSDGRNQLDTEGNRERAKTSAVELEDFEQRANWAGDPIAAAVSQAAERLANEPRKAKSIERELVTAIRGILGGSAGAPQDQLGEGGGAGEGPDQSGGGPERFSRRFDRRMTRMFEIAFSSGIC